MQIYGVRTLLNGTLLPAPHIGRRNEAVIKSARDAGYEVGIHCHDHYKWQDHLHTMSLEEIRAEFAAARAEFRRIFGTDALTAGAPPLVVDTVSDLRVLRSPSEKTDGRKRLLQV